MIKWSQKVWKVNVLIAIMKEIEEKGLDRVCGNDLFNDAADVEQKKYFSF